MMCTMVWGRFRELPLMTNAWRISAKSSEAFCATPSGTRSSLFGDTCTCAISYLAF